MRVPIKTTTAAASACALSVFAAAPASASTIAEELVDPAGCEAVHNLVTQNDSDDLVFARQLPVGTTDVCYRGYVKVFYKDNSNNIVSQEDMGFYGQGDSAAFVATGSTRFVKACFAVQPNIGDPWYPQYRREYSAFGDGPDCDWPFQ